VPRLRRVDCSGPGIVRRRRGRGFEYLGVRDPPPLLVGVLEEIGGNPELEDPRKRARIEAAVLDLLEDRRTDALERIAA
jgi:hypothetical protein